MPIYEYECKNCQHKLEEIQSFYDKPIRKCPKCKKLKLQKLISNCGAIVFKGPGFYATDYADKK